MPSRSKAELTATVGGCMAWGAACGSMPLETGGVCLWHGSPWLGGLMGAPRFANHSCGWPGFAALCWIWANGFRELPYLVFFLVPFKIEFHSFPCDVLKYT